MFAGMEPGGLHVEKLLFDRYTVKHMAELTGKSEETIRDRCKDGKYKYTKERSGRGIIILFPRGEDPTIEPF